MCKRIASIACLLLLVSPSSFSQSDPVVATVNGEKITKSEFDKRYAQNLLFVSDKVVTKKSVLDGMVNKILGIQRAKKQGTNKDPVVVEKMNEVLYHAQISKDLEPELKKIVVTDDDVKKYYNENPEYRTAHILFRVRAQPSKNEATAAQKKALEVYETLKEKPEKFADLANRYSQSSTAPNGGDMGFQPAIRMAPEYFRAIKGKADGHVTPPIRTQFGYHIIKVLAKKDFGSINTALYKKIVYDKKRDAILEKYFSNMQSGAKININKEFLKADALK
ncbi:MAG: peptidylprolyl isomerase [Bdellovibrionota bacterium]|nr:peptidylprolyl isomerase [Bdellovibrionota bacterium]